MDNATWVIVYHMRKFTIKMKEKRMKALEKQMAKEAKGGKFGTSRAKPSAQTSKNLSTPALNKPKPAVVQEPPKIVKQNTMTTP